VVKASGVSGAKMPVAHSDPRFGYFVYSQGKPLSMTKEQVIAMLRRDLHAVMKMRSAASDSAAIAAARTALRRFQSERLARTHADLLADEETRAAAQFFFEELYASSNFSRRDADIERIIPIMERLLPLAALKYIAEAIELDALSEALDSAMARRLGEHFTQAEYLNVYRSAGTRSERERQISHVQSVGYSLCELVQRPLIGTSLAAMRTPAKVAKLSELQRFLEKGYSAFKVMKIPQNFVSMIVQRENKILENIYAGIIDPFKISRKKN
jgi:hypothetical protein